MGFDKKSFERQYTDADGNPVDKHGNRINVDEQSVPMYRAYGKYKRSRLWLSKLYDITAVILFCLFIVLPFGSAIALIVLAAFKYAEMYSFAMAIVFLFILIMMIFIYAFILKIPRKRISFYRRLKKICNKKGYRITYHQSLLRSLIWSDDDKIDFIVKAGKWTYYVKLFGARDLKSDVTFCHDGVLIYRKLRFKSHFTTMFGLKPKIRKKKVVFPKYADGERAVKTIVLNPVPSEAYKKKPNGDTEMSGNDDFVFGYKIYSGTGFIEAICRNAALDEINIKNKKW